MIKGRKVALWLSVPLPFLLLRLWRKIHLIIYLFYQEKLHIKTPDPDQADATGKCTLEWIGVGEKRTMSPHK